MIYAGYDEVHNTYKEVSGAIIIGYIGKINKSKGCHYLNSFAERIFDNTGNKLIVAGTGDNDLIDGFDETVIEYLGFSEPSDFYKRVDAIVIPSIWYDPLPRVIYEAMSHNVVPFVSVYTGGKNVVSQIDPKLLFDPETEGSIKEVSKNITDINFLNAMKGKIASLTKKRKFSIEKASEQYIEFYNAVVQD